MNVNFMNKPLVLIDKEIYNIVHQTKKLMLKKSFSKLPDLLDIKIKEINRYSEALSQDETKTVKQRVLMLGKKIDSVIMELIAALDKERASTFVSKNEKEKKVEQETSFKDPTDVLLHARYADSIESKAELASLVMNSFEAAKVVLSDPLTKKRFKIDEGSPVYQMAKRTAFVKLFGNEGYDAYQNEVNRVNALDDYGKHLQQVLDKVEKVVNPIAEKVVA